MSLRYVTLDVFTERVFHGNPVAVFCDTPELAMEQMQRIARELNLSETVFVAPARSEHALRRVRIFMPTRQLAFGGHPIIGAAHALLDAGIAALSGGRGSFMLELDTGLVSVDVTRGSDSSLFVQITAPALPELNEEAPDRSAVARALGLSDQDLCEGADRLQLRTCGVSYLLVPVRNREALSRARPDMQAWRGILRKGPLQTFVFSCDTPSNESHIRARMFAPELGVVEDPATGGAAIALAACLAEREAGEDGTFRWVVEQGVEMDRPSVLHVEADKREGRVVAIRLGGTAVRVSEGALLI